MNLLSVVVPVYDEGSGLEKFHRALVNSLMKTGMELEIIYVDDGSKDDSLRILKSFQADDSRVKILSLSRNFGHQIALTAGLDHAQGEAVVMLDADLEHPPEVIPELIDKWKDGYDVVYTIRSYPASIGLLKRKSSELFYAFLKKFSSVPISENTADFRLLSRRAVDSLNSMPERYRFIRGLVSWIGFNQTSVAYTSGLRSAGTSHYSFFHMVRFALDGMTSFSSFPLYAAAVMGFIVSGFSFLYSLYIFYYKFFTNESVQGWTAIMLVSLYLGGVQLICLGIMGEYIGKIYNEIKQRPLYLIRESSGFKSNENREAIS